MARKWQTIAAVFRKKQAQSGENRQKAGAGLFGMGYAF